MFLFRTELSQQNDYREDRAEGQEGQSTVEPTVMAQWAASIQEQQLLKRQLVF